MDTQRTQKLGLMWLDVCYFFDHATLAECPNVLDIGAYSSERTSKLRVLFPSARIRCYEADPAEFAVITKPALPNSVTIRHGALGPSSGTADFYVYDHQTMSSLTRVSGAPPASIVSVPTLTIKDMMLSARMERVGLLMMNCEGAELWALLEILNDRELRERVGQICVSFHCDHVRAYPPAIRNALLAELAQHYSIIPGRRGVQYFLLVKQPRM